MNRYVLLSAIYLTLFSCRNEKKEFGLIHINSANIHKNELDIIFDSIVKVTNEEKFNSITHFKEMNIKSHFFLKKIKKKIIVLEYDMRPK